MAEEPRVHGEHLDPTPEFSGLAAVVTGGASGIGAAIADLLSSRGARVAVLDLAVTPVSRHMAVGCDIGEPASVEHAISRVVDTFGRLDIVINNAGVGTVGTVADNPDDQWSQVFSINVTGIARISRAALPHLRVSPAAAIVNMSSIAATAGLPQRALYSASKGAVLALTRAMAADHLGEGIRVNCVSPGTTDTPWVQRLLQATEDPARELSALKDRQPHGRLVSSSEVADAVAYLASPRAGSTTGVSIAVDGGMQALRIAKKG